MAEFLKLFLLKNYKNKIINYNNKIKNILCLQNIIIISCSNKSNFFFHHAGKPWKKYFTKNIYEMSNLIFNCNLNKLQCIWSESMQKYSHLQIKP